ncbi:hypothetical protein PQE71_gp056 [Bacillus phage Izhevsk]|uniref:Uncharacterized protein n=1 Tax=Bacillus phage Izhevsk TaxID=2724322 RepID=A0A6H0X600_9CAUD|nr:hypothetical protein PQE71_gp056 [Bacillus phage Izhevsk]QIW89738.1 hypothetical protein Izhevsk_57 [Bacillus phage Izhevsk]
MREIITDELVEKFARGYLDLKAHMVNFAGVDEDDVMTFEQYVESQLRFRKLLTRKALEHIEAKKA